MSDSGEKLVYLTYRLKESITDNLKVIFQVIFLYNLEHFAWFVLLLNFIFIDLKVTVKRLHYSYNLSLMFIFEHIN